jgi:hypothetical protein
MTSLQYICRTVTSGDSLWGPRILFELNCKPTVVYMDIKDWAKKLPWVQQLKVSSLADEKRNMSSVCTAQFSTTRRYFCYSQLSTINCTVVDFLSWESQRKLMRHGREKGLNFLFPVDPDNRKSSQKLIRPSSTSIFLHASHILRKSL